MKNQTRTVFTKTVLSSVIALAASPAVLAQQTTAESAVLEEVVVTAEFKRNLENALDAKRDSATIVDGISADDIGTLPALDMGEALQAVVGVQLNREGERRESSINLRGMPSGFVLTTANGQAFATPSRSDKAFGAPNPFGAYDPAIFNGTYVVKTQSADMQEGGIAGVVDLQIARALDKPVNALSLSVGGRSEQLADTIDPEIVISGSKHIIEDTLAVTATLATSQQTFRRDTIKINRYDNIPTNGNFVGANGEDFATWKADNGIPDNAVVKMPGELRQGSEINEGQRTSFAGGIEWQATDALKLGANIFYTERDMDDNGQQELDLRTRSGGTKITPNSTPFDTGSVNDNGDPVWTVSDILFDDVDYRNTSRIWDTYEQSQAVLLDAEWVSDKWTVDGLINISSAENNWSELFYTPYFRAGSSGINGRLYTGENNVENFVVELNDTDNLNLDTNWQVKDTLTSSGEVQSLDNSQIRTLVTGTYEELKRDTNSFEVNFERELDMPVLANVQFGYRYSSDKQDSDRLRNSPTGLDLTGIINNAAKGNPAYASQGNFFGGNVAGIAGAGQGWFALDVDAVNAAAIQTIGTVNPDAVTGEQPVIVPATGLVARGGQQSAGLVYDVELNTNALYLMGDLDFEVGGKVVTGNVGVRYVSSEQDASAPFWAFGATDINNPEQRSVKNDYTYVLPSLNLAMDVTDDVKVRFAYSETMSRPNVRAATPSSTVVTRPGEVNVGLPGADVDPFTAKGLDVSVEWYNREGSAITFAAFTKDIDNFFTDVGTCDTETLAGYGLNVGSLSVVGDNCVTDGQDAYDAIDPDYIMAGDIVNASKLLNSDENITVSGFELSLQQDLSFLPYPWNGFGGVLNYSNTKQDSSDPDLYIPGISDHTYNVIGYYEQGPFGIRLAYNYRSDYELESVGTFNGEGNKNVKAAGRVDLSAYYKVTDNFRLTLKGYNLNEALYEEYQATEFQPRAVHYDGRTWVLQASYNFF
ncbi:TonB-dependent receptor [Simiduia agarivorans]|uniref:Rhodanese-like protein n=1 Tax=Simiduia agarivorans (strain DSM 21679 / JCM 13881 / BCRC 17597 / SA1) TaxID=1117647 RepID=K4KIF1_SIMAS|nr:TonB-dependent receptor [Simiduia agarivorans]AFU98801.1 rhodanese-like protein [Simiduia agarivorans SA1 = DSM 21679]